MSSSLIIFITISGAALLCYAALLTLTLRKGLVTRAERYFAGYLGGMTVWSLGALLMYLEPRAAPQWNKVMLAGMLVTPLAFYGFVQGFLGRSERDPALYLGAAVMVVVQVLNALGYLAKDISVTEAGYITYSFAEGMVLAGAYFLFYQGLAGLNLLRDLRVTHEFAARNRIKYILVGLGAMLVGELSNIFPAAGAVPVDITANLVNALIITYAISRYHLLDLSLIVRKGLAYSLSTVVVAAGYLLILFLGADLLHLTGGTRILPALLVALAVAVVLQPGRDRVQNWVDRVFFREKYDAGLMLQRLSRQVTRLLDLEQLARLILEEVSDAMQVSAAALLIQERETGDYVALGAAAQPQDERLARALQNLRLRSDNPIAVWLARHDKVLSVRELSIQPQFHGLWAQERADLKVAGIELFIPLSVGLKLAGIMVLGSRRSEAPYTPEDLRTLQTLANQTAVAVQNAWLYRTALAEQARAQTILEAAFAGIVVVDRGLRIVAMNPSAEAITGRRLAALQGQLLTALIGPDLVAGNQPLAAALAAGSALAPTEVSLDGGGQPRDLLMGMTPLRDGFLLNFADITRLKEVDRLKSEIVANVSHELRGPLANIKGYTELLLEGMDGEDRALRQHFLVVINEETDRLASFIGDMLDLTRLESGSIELALSSTSVAALVADVVRCLELQAHAADVKVQVETPADLPPVTVDRGLMHSALRNLLSNAIKFSPHGAAVEVTARQSGPTVVVEVIDHGAGIPAEDLPYLFTKFHRGRVAREGGIGGSGLGLVLARQAIERHSGALAVESVPGQGARFIVTLPVGEEAAEAAPP